MGSAFCLASNSHVLTMSYTETVALLDGPIWRIFFTLAAIAASTFIPIFIYLKQQKRRRVTYQRIASIPLLTVKEELAGRLSVSFDGQPVKSIRTTTVRIKNAGNLPITAEDQREKCMIISAGSDAKILSADIVESTPLSLNPVLTVVESGAFVKPLLLNSGDSFVVKLLVQDGSEYIHVTGRFAGVKNFERIRDPDAQFRLKTSIAALIVGLGSTLPILFGPEKTPITRSTIDYVSMTIVFIGAAFFIGQYALDLLRKYSDSRSISKSNSQAE